MSHNKHIFSLFHIMANGPAHIIVKFLYDQIVKKRIDIHVPDF